MAEPVPVHRIDPGRTMTATGPPDIGQDPGVLSSWTPERVIQAGMSAGLKLANSAAQPGGDPIREAVRLAVRAAVVAALITSGLLWGAHEVLGGRAASERDARLASRIEQLEKQQTEIRIQLASIARAVGAEVK